MLIKHVLTNLMYFFLPVLGGSILALATNRVPPIWKKRILLLCLLSFIGVIAVSIVTAPSPESLQVEWAFYSLSENPDSTYDLQTLLGAEEPDEIELLGVRDTLGRIKGLPVVQSGDHAQMRVKPNRRSYVHIFHFDSTFGEVRRLFPSADIDVTNPIPSGSWAEFPVGTDSWTFDQMPGLEMFVVYVSTKESSQVETMIRKIVQQAADSLDVWSERADHVRNRLRSLGRCSSVSPGEYVHNMAGVIQPGVRSFGFQTHNGESAVLLQMVQHQP